MGDRLMSVVVVTGEGESAGGARRRACKLPACCGASLRPLFAVFGNQLLIRRSKTDQAGEGNLAYLFAGYGGVLQAWLAPAKITHGAVFRRLIGRGRIGDRLQVDAIAQTFKRVAEFVGMTEEEAREVKGHSIRVGATQDMLALNIDLASVTQAGAVEDNGDADAIWEEVQAGRGGMARTAKAQGRAK